MTPPKVGPPTVFVVDDDAQLRESLVLLLQTLAVDVRAFESALSFKSYYRADMPGCLLLDVRMPVQNGVSLYEQLLRERKRLPVIFMTAHADVSTAVTAMKSGAIEFLEKPFHPQTLVGLIRKALALDVEWRQREAGFALLEERINRISPREHETLALILAGKSNKAMAAELLLSERAVEMRRSNLMRKLGVDSLAELLELAVSHRILADLRQAEAQRQLR